MFRVFSTIIVLSLMAFLAVVIIGFSASPSYERTMSALYFDKADKVWEVLTDIEKYPESKNNVKRIEVIEKRFNSIIKWNEIISDNETREYEVIKKESPNLLVLKMKNTRTGLEGIWSYYVSQEGDRGKVTIKEESMIPETLWRGLLTILGRQRQLVYELKWLRVKLFQELIES